MPKYVDTDYFPTDTGPEPQLREIVVFVPNQLLPDVRHVYSHFSAEAIQSAIKAFGRKTPTKRTNPYKSQKKLAKNSNKQRKASLSRKLKLTSA